MLASTAVTTLSSLTSAFQLLGIAQTLMEFMLVFPATSALPIQPSEWAMTVFPLDQAASTYQFLMLIAVQDMGSGTHFALVWWILCSFIEVSLATFVTT